MHRIWLCFLLFVPAVLSAQFPAAETSSELYNDLLKASTTPRVLYMAAHPDDENTRLIAYFENALHARTAYLSLTRGAGGQNLIGTEIGPAIGVLRTQELLRARSIDGGEQFFTRAVDFGYSKTASESFEKWGKQNVLSDVVRVIREFRPHVIVTRFPPTNYAGHGHHQASAILAEEAFDLAADPTAFPEQLDELDTWQPVRLYFNASTWWNKDLAQEARDSEEFLMIDVGEYNPLLGESYAQIAARSRSSHASQGFGADYPYGTTVEYLQYVKGDKANQSGGILAGIERGWSGTTTPTAGEVLNRAIAEYDFLQPQNSASDLISALKILRDAEPTPLVENKRKELEDLLIAVAPIDLALNASSRYTVPGDSLTARLTINNASGLETHVVAIDGKSPNTSGQLRNNDLFSVEWVIPIDPGAPYSEPYWLQRPFDNLYEVADPRMIGRAENEPALSVSVDLSIEGYELRRRVPARYKTVDPTRGVVFAPVYIVPPVTYNFSEEVVVAAGTNEQHTELTATAHADRVSGAVKVVPPPGWTASPEVIQFDFEAAGDKKRKQIVVTRTGNALSGDMRLEYLDGSNEDSRQPLSLTEIDYDHIPAQILLKPAAISLAAVDLDRGGVQKVGYIDGPGDDVAKYLRAAGYTVTSISSAELTAGPSPSDYDAIVTGIRAFNTREDLMFANKKLNDYVKAGGTWIVQYNTTRGLKTEDIGPYPFTITRERVTDEDAVARFLMPEHPIMHSPNKLTEKDFDAWVQERGLYFANEWDAAFSPILGWNDPEEPSRDGGLIIAPYGEGYFVYTGISFFRQLPAGVPGAYRLLANMLALSKTKTGDHE